MRLDRITVHLRSRTPWEAMELGIALVRRDAATIWKSWALVVVPLYALLNVGAAAVGNLGLAWLLLLWLKPMLDRIPLYVVSRSVFGATPGVRETVRAQLGWGWRVIVHYLTWRRLSPARSLLMPIELLEGIAGARLRERRRVLAGSAYGNAILLTAMCIAFEGVVVLGCTFAILLYVEPELLPDTLRTAWSMLRYELPWWATLSWNLFVGIAVTVVEPFFVGAGFGLYLNRRTQIEAWDVEIAFRKLRSRLSAAATPLLLVLALLGAAAMPARAQEEKAPPVATATMPAKPAAPTKPTLPEVFGAQRVDEARFGKAVDRAYRDPLLNGERTEVRWEKRDKTKPAERNYDAPWLQALREVFALIAEWGLWVLVGALLLVLALTARHWLPWMRGSLRRQKPLPADVETEVLVVPEALPDDVPSEARRLWAQGKPRHALALLYRASVETMARRADVVLAPGATESECLRASRRMPDADDRSLFARTVRTWQYAAYAWQLPAAEDFEDLLQSLQQRFRWSA